MREETRQKKRKRGTEKRNEEAEKQNCREKRNQAAEKENRNRGEEPISREELLRGEKPSSREGNQEQRTRTGTENRIRNQAAEKKYCTKERNQAGRKDTRNRVEGAISRDELD